MLVFPCNTCVAPGQMCCMLLEENLKYANQFTGSCATTPYIVRLAYVYTIYKKDENFCRCSWERENCKDVERLLPLILSTLFLYVCCWLESICPALLPRPAYLLCGGRRGRNLPWSCPKSRCWPLSFLGTLSRARRGHTQKWAFSYIYSHTHTHKFHHRLRGTPTPPPSRWQMNLPRGRERESRGMQKRQPTRELYPSIYLVFSLATFAMLSFARPSRFSKERESTRRARARTSYTALSMPTFPAVTLCKMCVSTSLSHCVCCCCSFNSDKTCAFGVLYYCAHGNFKKLSTVEWGWWLLYSKCDCECLQHTGELADKHRLYTTTTIYV